MLGRKPARGIAIRPIEAASLGEHCNYRILELQDPHFSHRSVASTP
jgi:hypothetical protein